MLTRVLERLSAEVRPLTVVSDPDGILADEAILAELGARGIRLIVETDPVALRYRYQQLVSPGAADPVMVVTSGTLDRLPYDLWQQGWHVSLALHALFPNLDYPMLRSLSPAGRSRLAQVQTAGDWPERPLSPAGTGDFLLAAVFGAPIDLLGQPAGLLSWLARYHAAGDPLPAVLAERLLNHLRTEPELAGWPLGELIADPDTCRRFVQEGWDGFVRGLIADTQGTYETGAARPALDFGHDRALQDAVPLLVGAGTLAPVTVDRPAAVPAWARPAVAVDEDGVRLRQLAETAESLEQLVAGEPLRWATWDMLARRWAQLSVWRSQFDVRLPGDLFERIASLQDTLDARFATWLTAHYTALATRPLPPHHLWHVPIWLQHHYGVGQQRIALLVLDGMAWADWLLIRAAWQASHPAWDFAEDSVLAQIPSTTAVSRQALLSGQRPAAFPETLTGTAAEARGWAAFWHRAGLSADAVASAQVSERTPEAYPPVIDSRRIQALALVSVAIDDMVHGATQGQADILGSVQQWLRNSQRVAQTIAALLRNRYAVTLTSDHGHVAAVGMGQPSEGVTVTSRGKRARLYNNEDFARTVHAQYPETVLWHDDDVLPAGWWALMPDKRQAFAADGSRVVSHGGTTFEELIVPLVTISARD